MDAVIGRNAERAIELMTGHLNLTTRILIEALPETSPATAPNWKPTPGVREASEAPIKQVSAD
jgi:hypothetical protein